MHLFKFWEAPSITWFIHNMWVRVIFNLSEGCKPEFWKGECRGGSFFYSVSVSDSLTLRRLSSSWPAVPGPENALQPSVLAVKFGVLLRDAAAATVCSLISTMYVEPGLCCLC